MKNFRKKAVALCVQATLLNSVAFVSYSSNAAESVTDKKIQALK